MKRKSATPVILDTNVLIMQMEYRIDLEDQLTEILGSYEILIPDAVLYELEHIQDKHSMAAANFAKRFRIIDSVKRGDDAILSLAINLNAVVVTNDRELRRRLKEKDLNVIYIRQRSYLVLDIA